MGLKDVLLAANEPVVNQKESSLKAETSRLSETDLQNKELWEDTPDSQFLRVELAAAFAKEKNQEKFKIDEVEYNTQKATSFIAAYRSLRPENEQKELHLLGMKEFAKMNGDNSVFGKNFGSAENTVKGIDALYRARKEKKATFNIQDREYDTMVDLASIQQEHFFGNINEEIKSPQDAQTKDFLRKYAQEKIPPLNAPIFQEMLRSQYLKKLYDLSEACGYPNVRSVNQDSSVVGTFAELGRGEKTSHFSPNISDSGGTIYLKSNNDFVPEMAHAFRNKNNTVGEAGQFIGDGLKDVLTLNSLGFTPKAQSANYKDKGKMEYDAHSVVEPKIEAFMDGNIKTIPQMYASIEEERKKQGTSYSQTASAKEQTKQGIFENDQEKNIKIAAVLNNRKTL